MKICHVCAVDFTLNQFLLPLIDQMAKEGWDVSTICSDGSYCHNLRQKGYSVINVEIPRNLNIYKIIKAIILMYKQFKKSQFDVVHTHTPVASVIARIAAKLAKTPIIIYTAHGFYFHENMNFFKYYFFLLIEKIFSKITNLLFVQSKEDFNIALKYNFINENKLFHIGNGVSKKKFNPNKYKNIKVIKNNINLPINSFVIGFIGRLVEEKGILEFLDAASTVIKKNKNVLFLLVGDRLGTDHGKNIRENIFKYKKIMKNKLILLGHRDDIPKLLSVMDVFCLPSWREGLSRSIIEAMMMGKPVITTNIRGCREQIIDHENGLIVPIKSSMSLSKAMQFLVNNPNISKRYGKLARSDAINNYDEQKVIYNQIKIIKQNFKSY